MTKLVNQIDVNGISIIVLSQQKKRSIVKTVTYCKTENINKCIEHFSSNITIRKQYDYMDDKDYDISCRPPMSKKQIENRINKLATLINDGIIKFK
jgi:hypothetical protein